MNHLTISTPLGDLLAFANDDGLTGLYYSVQRNVPDTAQSTPAPQHPVLQQTQKELDEYFSGKRRQFTMPLAAKGTPFQQQVWAALRALDYGQTLTYLQLARQLGNERGVRAVAQGVARNPLIVVVPCHRIIGTNGSLTGFAAGVERKLALLQLEGAHR